MNERKWVGVNGPSLFRREARFLSKCRWHSPLAGTYALEYLPLSCFERRSRGEMVAYSAQHRRDLKSEPAYVMATPDHYSFQESAPIIELEPEQPRDWASYFGIAKIGVNCCRPRSCPVSQEELWVVSAFGLRNRRRFPRKIVVGSQMLQRNNFLRDTGPVTTWTWSLPGQRDFLGGRVPFWRP